MKWYYRVGGGHTHVRVFMNGGKCGDLCFRNEEFAAVRKQCPAIFFVDEVGVDRLLAEPPMTMEQAESAFDAAPSIPISKERINEMIRCAVSDGRPFALPVTTDHQPPA